MTHETFLVYYYAASPPREELLQIVKDATGIEEIRVVNDITPYATLQIKPNFEVLGPLYKERVKDIAKYLKQFDSFEEEIAFEDIVLTGNDLVFRAIPKEGDFVVASTKNMVGVYFPKKEE